MPTTEGKSRTLSLDGRIEFAHIRDTQARWLLLTGTTRGSQIESTYTFCRDVLDYDLAGFFQRHSRRIKVELEKVLKTLLRA